MFSTSFFMSCIRTISTSTFRNGVCLSRNCNSPITNNLSLKWDSNLNNLFNVDGSYNTHKKVSPFAKLPSNYHYYSSKTNNINFHSHIASLKTKKRPHRKKRKIDEHSELDAGEFRVKDMHRFLTFDPVFSIPSNVVQSPISREFQIAAYATANEYDLEELRKEFHRQGLYVETSSTNSDDRSLLKSNTDVLHLSAAYKVTQEPRSMFIFRDGVIVFWNVNSMEIKNVFSFVSDYGIQNYSSEVVQEESETLLYTYSDSQTRIKSSQNLIYLNQNVENNLEKFAFSNALAMSVKLGIWESSLDDYIDNIEFVTERLGELGKVVLSQKQVLQRMGQLFALRHQINLSSDLLDTPDFYWEHEYLEQLYNRMANHLNIQKRTSVMNTKLSHCLELMDLMKSHLQEQHASKLESIIIILIMIEVFFELIHFSKH